MQTIPSAFDRLDARAAFKRELSDSYTNTLVENELLNGLILRANMFIAKAYRNVINAAMESRATRAAKEVYQLFVLDQEQRDKYSKSNVLALQLERAMATGGPRYLGRHSTTTTTTTTPKKERRQLKPIQLDKFNNHPVEEYIKLRYHQQQQQQQQQQLYPDDANQERAWLSKKTEYELYVPERSEFFFGLMGFVGLFLFFRYLTVAFALYEIFPRKTLVTLSKSVSGLLTNRIGSASDGQISLANKMQAATANDSNKLCRLKLESYLNDNYGDMLIWNSSAGIGQGNLPFLDNFLLLEQSQAIQMFSQEAKVIVYLLATFVVTCGIMGNIVSQLVPYDISVFVFALEPKFVAFSVQARVNYYLNLIRTSYLNFWTAFQLAPDNSLVTRDVEDDFCEPLEDPHTNSVVLVRSPSATSESSPSSWTPSPGANLSTGDQQRVRNRKLAAPNKSQPSQLEGYKWRHPYPQRLTDSEQAPFGSTCLRANKNIVDSVCLNHQQFENYMPTARSQAWRRVVLISNPIVQSIAVAVICLFLGGVFMVFVETNRTAAELNSELKALLGGTGEPDELRQLRRDCLALDGIEVKLEAIQEALVDHVVPKLDSVARENSYEANYVAIGFTEPPAPTTEDNAKQYYREYKRLLENSIGPTVMPDFFDWSVVNVGVLFTAVLTTIYINMFAFTMFELCFWLIELRMKLNVCTVIMKHYELKSNIDLRLSYHVGKFDWSQLETMKSPRTSSSSLASAQLSSLASSASLASSQIMAPLLAGGRGQLRPLASLSGALDEPFNGTGLTLNQEAIFRHSLASSRRNQPDDGDKLSVNTNDDADDDQRRLTSGLGSLSPSSSSSSSSNSADNEQMTTECNLKMLQVVGYLVASRASKMKLCEQYAGRLINADLMDSTAPKRATEKFLTSTYLDFRLFQDQIDDCRRSMNFLISYTVLHALNMVASSTLMDDLRIKIGLIIAGTMVSNLTLIGASFFQSQCCKLHHPIYSILAASIRGDKTIRHLALLWRRILTDLAGARSRFSLRVYSLNVSYATTLQFNLSIASLYILSYDKTKY